MHKEKFVYFCYLMYYGCYLREKFLNFFLCILILMNLHKDNSDILMLQKSSTK